MKKLVAIGFRPGKNSKAWPFIKVVANQEKKPIPFTIFGKITKGLSDSLIKEECK